MTFWTNIRKFPLKICSFFIWNLRCLVEKFQVTDQRDSYTAGFFIRSKRWLYPVASIHQVAAIFQYRKICIHLSRSWLKRCISWLVALLWAWSKTTDIFNDLTLLCRLQGKRFILFVSNDECTFLWNQKWPRHLLLMDSPDCVWYNG